MNSNWNAVSYVISSKYRVKVLRRLAGGPSTPSQIARESDVSIAHVSRALSNLQERNLVVLLVSEERTKGRVYDTTDKGENIWNTIEAENLL